MGCHGKSKESADGSASQGATFTEEIPRKKVFSDLWMNLHEKPPERGRQLEAAEDGTLMGRLASRMAARDMIDELDLGPKGKSPEAKKATVADGAEDLKTGIKIEEEHKETVNKLKKNPKLENKEVYKNIAKDHLKEHDDYYDKMKGLPAMERKLEKADADELYNQIPTKLVLGGAGRHYQTLDLKASNTSDPAPDKGSRKGNNMADQAKNAGNVFNTMHK